jgi:hypothetical protein
MAKLYGNLVGSQVQALAQGRIGIVPPHCKDTPDQVLWRDYAVFQGAAVGDTISMGVLKSTALVDPLNSVIANDAMTGVRWDLGDVSFPTAFAAALNVEWGQTVPLVAAMKANLVAAPLWQLLGYLADPGRPIELLARIAAASTAPPANGTAFIWALYGRAGL